MLPRYIARRYRILNILGQGALGRVYLAFDPESRDRVALKVLNPEAKGFEQRFRTFKNEFDALRGFRHPNIVQVYDIGVEESGAPFFTMEYVAGPNLVEYGYRSLDELCRLLSQLLHGLEYLHSRNYLHRDIKGANVLVQVGVPDGDGEVTDTLKLVDFGFAVQGTTDQYVRGTAEYLAPEVVLHGRADRRSDLFSVGCLAYLMLTGHYPGGGRYPGVMREVARVRQDFERRRAPRSVRHYNPDVSTALEGLVLQLLSFEPSARPGSATAVLDALRDISSTAVMGALGDTHELADQFPYLDVTGVLRRITGMYEAQRSGVVLVSGHRRMGKSRLLEEVRAELGQRGAEVILSRFTEFGDPASAPLERIPRRILSFHPEREALLIESCPTLFRRSAIPTDADLARAQMENELVSLLGPELRERPVVLLLDDVQWADRESSNILLSAVERLLGRIPAGSVLLVVATGVPESELPSRWSTRLKAEEIPEPVTFELRPFETDEIRKVLGSVGQWASGLDEAAEFLGGRTGGIPGSMEAWWKELVAGRFIANLRGSWRVRESLEGAAELNPSDRDWPELARLSSDERSILEVMAGYDRWVVVTEVEAVCPSEVGLVSERLDGLVAAGLVRQSEQYFRLATASLRSHVYTAIAKEQRRNLHARIARTIERRYRADLPERYEELAVHFVNSSDDEAARRYVVLAARRLAGQHRYSRALVQYRHAVQLHEGRDEEMRGVKRTAARRLRLDLWLEMAQAACDAEEDEESAEAIRGAFEVSRLLRGPLSSARVAAVEAGCRQKSWTRTRAGTTEEVEAQREVLTRHLDRLAQSGSTREAQEVRAEVLWHLAFMHQRLGDHAAVVDALEERLTLLQQLGRLDVHHTLVFLGTTLRRCGRYDDALWVLHEGRAAALRAGEPAVAASAHTHLAHLLAEQDKMVPSLEHYHKAEAIFGRLKLEGRLAANRQSQADIMAEIGMARAAGQLADEVLDFHGRKVGSIHSVRAQLVLGKARYRLGDYLRAEESLIEVIEYVKRRDLRDHALRFHSRVYLGRVRAEMGDSESALELHRAVVEEMGLSKAGVSTLHVMLSDCLLSLASVLWRTLLAGRLSGERSHDVLAAFRRELTRAGRLIADSAPVERARLLALEACGDACGGDRGALSRCEAAVSQVHRLDYRLPLLEVAYLSGSAAFLLGEYARASVWLETAREATAGLDVPELAASIHGVAMLVAVEAGRRSDAIQHHRDRLDIVKSVLAQLSTRESQEQYLSEPLRAAFYRRGHDLAPRKEGPVHV